MLNLVPQPVSFNRSGHWRSVEILIAKLAKELGNNLGYIDWYVFIWYNNSNRPVKYIVHYSIINKQGAKEIDNTVEFDDLD